MSTKKSATLKKEHAATMYKILVDLNRAYYVKGGHPDDIAEIAARSLAIVRRIDMYPALEQKFKTENKQP